MEDYIYMVVKDYNPVHQISREDLDVARYILQDFGIVMDDDYAMRLLTPKLYHKIRMFGASDTEVRDELYVKAIKLLMGTFSHERHHCNYEVYAEQIKQRAKAIIPWSSFVETYEQEFGNG